jgi:hypothetical protein
MDENVPPANADSPYRHPQPYLLSAEALEYFLHEKALRTSSYATSSGASRSSEGLEYLVAGDAEDGETLELSVTRDAHLSRNKRKLNSILPNWNIVGFRGAEQWQWFLVRRPTASKISSLVMHPGFYRASEMTDIADIDAFAEILRLDDGWKEKVQLARQDYHVRNDFRRFIQLRGSEREEIVELAINNLLKCLSNVLQVEIFSNGQRSFAVGGMLAHNEYVVHGRTDANFIDGNEKLLLSTEVKTSSSFPMGATWYHASRGLQTLAGLCSSPTGSPTLLVTPEQFKFFFVVSQSYDESNDASIYRVCTYPSGYDTMETGAQFLDALSICLLRGMPLPETPPDAVLDGSKVGQSQKSVPTATKAPAHGKTESNLDKTGGMNLETLFNAAADDDKSISIGISSCPQKKLSLEPECRIRFPWAEVQVYDHSTMIPDYNSDDSFEFGE